MKEICKPDAALTRLILPQKAQPGILYVPSQFTLPFSHNERQFVFHTFTKQLIEGTLPRSAHVGEGFDDLIESMFLVPEDKDECAYYESIAKMMRHFMQPKGVIGYTILPTLGCNARCVYCYEEGYKQVTMTPEIAEQTLRFILNTRSKDKITINWFGGEPLLCQGIIDHICDRLRKEDIPFQSVIITNGSLITPETIDKMKNLWNLKRVQISMDGAEPDYIARKRYYADSDQYHSVMNAIDRLSEAGIAVALRVNVEESNWPGIPQFMSDLKEHVAHKENVYVYFSPLMHVRAGQDDLAFWEEILSAQHLITDAGFRVLPFLKPSRRFRANRCMADGGSVVICPDGRLYTCEHCSPGTSYGDVFNGTTDAALERELRRADRTREMCRKCRFLPECTSFASCPCVDAHCKEVHEINAVDALKNLVDKHNKEEETDGDDTVC
jgi:radical SAM protein with 4Fe4S-binding SPASM domain